MKPKVSRRIRQLLKRHNQGIKLDLGCGENKQPGFIGMDLRKLKNVDIVHNVEKFPFPFPDESCSIVLASHLIEHIKPWLMLKLMDEVWRIMKTGGQFWLALPYALSFGFCQDPTHCNPCNEATWTYFDPEYPLYEVYRPRPWRIERNIFQFNGNMEVILEKRPGNYVGRFSKPKGVSHGK